MDVNELSARIRDTYRGELDAFRQQLFGVEEHLVVRGESVPEQRFAGLGPVASLENPRVALTLGGEVTDLGWTPENPAVEGAHVTISAAGHDRITGERASLPSGECDAWLQAVIGADRIRYAYRAGTISGADERLSTVYYHLFLDAGGNPVRKPEDFKDPDLQPINEG